MDTEVTSKSLSGRRVVVAMVLFAVFLIYLMWLYLERHTAPFRPLQHAIHEEFPNSVPLVQGGQRKMHRDSPKILRITIRVDFDPNDDQDRVQQIVRRLTNLAEQHQDLQSYDELEFHLIWFRSEQDSKMLTITRNLSGRFESTDPDAIHTDDNPATDDRKR